KVDQTKTPDWNSLVAAIQAKPKQKITVTIKRGQRQLKTSLTPKAVKESGKAYGQIGIMTKVDHSIIGKVKYGFTATWSMGSQILKVLGSFFTGGFSLNKLSGPVGI